MGTGRVPAVGLAPPQLWRRFLLAGVVAVVAYELLPGGQDGVYVGVGLAAVVAVQVGWRLNLPRHHGPWRLFAAGLGIWVLGDLVLVAPWPTAALVSSAAYAAGYPLLALGLLRLVRLHTPRSDLAGILDAATVTVGLVLPAYLFLASPFVADPRFDTADTTLRLLFLLGDILLVGGMVRVAASSGRWQPATRLLVAALVLVVAGDVVDASYALAGSEQPSWLDGAYLVSYLCWGAAALHPSMVELTEVSPPARFAVRTRLTVAGVSATLPALAIAVQQALGRDPDVWAALVGTAVLVGLLMGRQQLAFDRIQQVTTQTRELQEQLTYEATHDLLTLLPNRAHGLHLLEGALERSAADGGTVTVMFLDLDGFKLVNDNLGHRAGDQLLRRVAERLTRSVREGDVAVRLGGDEFVLVLESLQDAGKALEVAERVIGAISSPVHLGPQGTARVGASIGIAQSHDGATDAATLLNEADLAAYRAKVQGKGRAELFDADLRRQVVEQEQLALELRTALRHDQLQLDYQPVVDSMTGEVRGYEALVRWQHPERGRLLPGEFLPVAESSDLVCDLDRWVLLRAATQMQAWVASGEVDGPIVAVNISTTSAARSRLVTDVSDALRVSGLAPDRLVLELPERVLDDTARTVPHLRLVRALGVSVSVADFGSAVGALARMSELPVNVVKIGRSALDTGSPLGDDLLRLMIQGAHAVGLNAVAEGVEHDDQLATLRTLDCEMVQGFHIARPMAAAEVPAYQQAVTDRFSGLLP